jgi:hypothetical protein
VLADGGDVEGGHGGESSVGWNRILYGLCVARSSELDLMAVSFAIPSGEDGLRDDAETHANCVC